VVEPAEVASLKQRVQAQVDALMPDLLAVSRFLHANPEIAYEERQAAELLTDILEQHGFAVTRGVADLPTAFTGLAGDSGPQIAFLAEYDALPGIGHACGHNLIAAAAIGAGLGLARALKRGRVPGTVVVMGTPGEEGFGGKVAMISRGALEGIDAVMLAHPRWRTMADTGSNAIARFRVAYRGRAAHAAAAPERGRNALDAVMSLFQGINAWRQHVVEGCRIHGIVTEGGAMANIVPERAAAVVYLRAMDDRTLGGLVRRLRAIAKGAALMTATSVSVEPWGTAYKARVPNGPLNEAFVEAARAAGLRPEASEGPNRASSDFGDVSRVRPGAHVYFGIARRDIPVHSPEFRDAAGTEYAMDRMLRAAEALAAAGLRYAADESFRKRVAADFRRSVRTAR